MAEKIAKEYENAMKKGFIGVLILLVLENSPSYGYKITKEIKKRTLGLWNPPSSTMYTLLKNLAEKGLIKVSEENNGVRIKKIYKITTKGKETLKLILERKKMIENSMESLKIAMLGNGENFEKSHKYSPFDFFIKRLDEKSDDEKLEHLIIEKSRIKFHIERLALSLEKIEEVITNIKQKK